MFTFSSLLKVKLGVIDLARERVNSRLDQFSGQSESTATAEAGAVVDGQGGGVPAYEGGNNQQYQGNSQQSQGNSQQNQGYQGNNQQYQGNQQQQHQQQPFRPSYPSNQGGDSYTNAAAAGYSSGDSAGVAYDHNAQQIAGSEYSGQGQNYASNGGRDYQSGGHSNAASLSNSGSFGSNDNYDNSGSGNNDGISSNSFGSSDSFGSTDNFESNSLSADTKSGSESGSSSNTGSSAGIGGIAELVRWVIEWNAIVSHVN